MYGHEGTYYSGGGDFGFKTTNYAKLSGSVLGKAYSSSLSLTPNTNVASYRTALLLDPFRYEYVTKHGYKDWGNDAFNSLMNKGQAVTYYRDSAVTHSRVVQWTTITFLQSKDTWGLYNRNYKRRGIR